jgi:hypothetical protein
MDFPVKKQKQRVLPAPDKSVSPSSQKGGMPPHASPLLKKHKQTPVVPSVPLLTTKKGAQGRCDRVSRFEGTLLRLEALDAVKIKRATDSSVAKFKMAVRFEGFKITKPPTFYKMMNEVLRLPQDCNKSGDIKLASGVRETMRYLALLPVDIAIDGRYDWNSHEFQFLDKVRKERLERAIQAGKQK